MQTSETSRDWSCLPRVKIIGRMMFDPVWSSYFHHPNGLEILHVLHGRITIYTENTKLTAQNGDLALIPSKVHHRDDINPCDDIEVFFCSIDWEHERDFFKSFPSPPRPILIPSREHNFHHLLEDLRSDTSDNLQVDRAIASARIMLLLMQIYLRQTHLTRADRANTDNQASRQHLLMKKTKDYISRHYAERISLDDIAAALKVSPYYISRIFRQEAKFTLSSYLTEVRMKKAKSLLADKRQTVAEVADAVGYDDPHYFSKVFQRYYGYPPTDVLLRQPQADLRAGSRPPRPQ
ncbi:MAG: helix-turn-helix domain-containing protein [Kiritimatiellia bacterium]|jgi:AraC-like DNA-binding protein